MLLLENLKIAVGETTNLMQIDTQKFLDLSLYLNLVWTSPLQIVLAMYFLWNILGPSSLAGNIEVYTFFLLLIGHISKIRP